MFAVQFGALYTAMADGLTAGTASLIACSSPLAVAAIGAASGWERLRPLQWLGIGLGVLGVVVTLADRVGRPPNAASLLWALIGLAGLAVGTTLQARVGTEAGAAAVASVEVAAGFAVLAVWAPLDGDVALPLTAVGLAIVVVALMLTTGRLVPASVRQAAPATPEGSPARSWSGSPRSSCGPRRPEARAGHAPRPRPPARASAPRARLGS